MRGWMGEVRGQKFFLNKILSILGFHTWGKNESDFNPHGMKKRTNFWYGPDLLNGLATPMGGRVG